MPGTTARTRKISDIGCSASAKAESMANKHHVVSSEWLAAMMVEQEIGFIGSSIGSLGKSGYAK